MHCLSLGIGSMLHIFAPLLLSNKGLNDVDVSDEFGFLDVLEEAMGTLFSFIFTVLDFS